MPTPPLWLRARVLTNANVTRATQGGLMLGATVCQLRPSCVHQGDMRLLICNARGVQMGSGKAGQIIARHAMRKANAQIIKKISLMTGQVTQQQLQLSNPTMHQHLSVR